MSLKPIHWFSVHPGFRCGNRWRKEVIFTENTAPDREIWDEKAGFQCNPSQMLGQYLTRIEHDTIYNYLYSPVNEHTGTSYI